MNHVLKILFFLLLSSSMMPISLNANSWDDPWNSPWLQPGQFLCADVSCSYCPYNMSIPCVYAGELDERVCQFEYVLCGDPDRPLDP